jgi:tetratricopeptide (TPR) repeat protein
MLANALFDRHDFVGFEAAGERAIALNPNDPDILAHFGLRLVYMGEWERGLALVTKAIALNPEFPEFYRDPLIFYYYQTGTTNGLWWSRKDERSRVCGGCVQGDDSRAAGPARRGAAGDRSGARAEA